MIPNALLEQSHFIRTLAQQLVFDENHAEDIVQKAWVVALRKPPRCLKSPQGWLSTVVRNLVRLEKRDEIRRIKREKVVARPELLRQADDIVEMQSRREMVVRAVMQLKEPYFSAILMRYYHDLPPRTIAMELNVPLATAKTWVHRGREKLRRHLDARFNGDRKAWQLALTSLAGLSAAAATGKAAAAGAAAAGAAAAGEKAAAGCAGAGLKSAVALGAAAVLLALSAFWFLTPEGGRNPANGAAASLAPGFGLAAAGEGIDREVDPRIAGAFATEPLRPDRIVIAGRVVDLLDEEPVRAFDVRLTDPLSLSPDQAVVFFDRIESETGEFTISVSAPPGAYRLTAASPRHRPETIEVALSGGDLSGLLLELDPGLAVAGLVFDRETLQPIPNAIVGVEERTHAESILSGMPGSGIHAWTDAGGAFELQGLPPGPAGIAVAHPDYAQGRVETRAGAANAVIYLSAGRRISGTVRDDSGAPAPGIAVCLAGNDGFLSWPVFAGQDGRYEIRIPAQEPSQLWVTACAPPDRDHSRAAGQAAAIKFTQETKSLPPCGRRAGAADEAVDFGPSAEHVTWRGTLRDGAGVSVPHAAVFVTALTGPGIPQPIRCDASGAFACRKLLRNSHYRLSILFPSGRSEVIQNDVILPAGAARSITSDLCVAAGSVSGTVRDETTGEPLPSGVLEARIAGDYAETIVSRCVIGAGGAFRLFGLPSGTYRLFRRDLPLPQHDAGFDPARPVTGSDGGAADITLGDGQAIEGVSVYAAPRGILCFTGSGFAPGDVDLIRLLLRDTGGSFGVEAVPPLQIGRGFKADGTISFPVRLPAGRWEALVSLGSGPVRQTEGLFVPPNATVDLAVPRSHLAGRAESATVSGSVRTGDGSPVSGIEVRFVKRGSDPNDVVHLRAFTDSDGMYLLDGVTAGDWEVHLLRQELPSETPSCNRNSLMTLVVPGDVPPIIQLDLTKPIGAVSAILRDAGTLEPIGDSDPWFARVTDSTGRKVLFKTPCAGSHLEIDDLPPGQLQLMVHVTGFEPYCTDLDLVDGMPLDLGDIALHRCE